MKKNTLKVSLGYVGHKAEKFQKLFKDFTPEPNDYGYFLRFEDFNMLGNKGTLVYTNVVDTDEEVHEMIYDKLVSTL